MSGIGDALKAIRKAILLEERITSQSKKLEQLALNVVEMDKRLAALEGRMDGFLAAASAFGSGARRQAKLIEAAPKERPSTPPVQEI
ncbi:MAG TPA: hypothetical protein VMU78_09740 [Methylocella sp.]|nr:hypothetical protein [Methylocella sp.]